MSRNFYMRRSRIDKPFGLYRFRGIVATTIFFRKWLKETSKVLMEDNLKGYMASLSAGRQQHDGGVLTSSDKMLLSKPYDLRTMEERQQLVHLIANLPIFSVLSPKVRARLATVVYFVNLEAGRKLIHQGQEPRMLYFLLNGEIAVKTKHFDTLKNVYSVKLDYVTGAGDWIGDVELLECIPRRHSYITITEVELLAVTLEDFDVILRPSLSKLWNNKKTTMINLGYFDHFTQEQLICAAHLAVIKQFNPLDTVFHEKGKASCVHFVISGDCMILQCLKLKVTHDGKDKNFELAEIEPHEIIFPELSDAAIIKQFKQEIMGPVKSAYEFDKELKSDESLLQPKHKKGQKVDWKIIELRCATHKTHGHLLRHRHKSFISRSRTSKISAISSFKRHEKASGITTKASEVKSEKSITAKMSAIKSEKSVSRSSRLSAKSSKKIDFHHKIVEGKDDYLSSSSEETEYSYDSEMYEEEWSSDFSFDSEITLNSTQSDHPSHIEESTADPGVKIENHFIDVGSITRGGICGLGEHMEHRVIMARTSVHCLLLPRFWLLLKSQNAGNIWERRRIYLDNTIPSRQSLFKDFLKTQNWQALREKIVQSRVKRVVTDNATKTQDIPIIGRIIEHEDFFHAKLNCI